MAPLKAMSHAASLAMIRLESWWPSISAPSSLVRYHGLLLLRDDAILPSVFNGRKAMLERVLIARLCTTLPNLIRSLGCLGFV